jgi:hypothetical protein
MAITGIPPYQEPLAQFVRCICDRRYLVWAVSSEPRNVDRSRSDYTFIDARKVPLMKCGCGQVLDFTADVSSQVQ